MGRWDFSPYEKQRAKQTFGEVGRWDSSPYEKQRAKQTLWEVAEERRGKNPNRAFNARKCFRPEKP